MDTMAFQIASLTIACSTVYSGEDQRNYQSSAQMANNVENVSIWWRHRVILQWHYYMPDGASDHRRLDYLLNRFFRCGSKKTSKLRVTGLCEGNSSVTGELPQKGPVTRKIFPFDDVIMTYHPWRFVLLKLTYNEMITHDDISLLQGKRYEIYTHSLVFCKDSCNTISSFLNHLHVLIQHVRSVSFYTGAHITYNKMITHDNMSINLTSCLQGKQ